MTFAALFLIVALVVYGLERNRRRQPQPRQRLAGSVKLENRDTTWAHPVIT